jgi:hypothetical protein
MPRLTPVALTLSLVSVSAGAQQPTRGATIMGTVRDSLSQPIAGADIIAQRGNHRTRSDSAGKYVLTDLDGGAYIIAARKVGYAPGRWDAIVSKSGRVEINFVLARRVVLDTVSVTAVRDCPIYSLDGFECRRAAQRGMFLDYAEIDEQGALVTADLFRGLPGFRVEARSATGGPVRVAVPASYTGCIASLVDGRPASSTNPIPPKPSDLSGIEIYLNPDSVPEPYRRFTWASRQAHRRCSMVVYWTLWAPLGRLEASVAPP